jgi:ribosomal protein S18 acetylase RimI-like enzyme
MSFDSRGKEFVPIGEQIYLHIDDVPVGHIQVAAQDGYDQIWDFVVYKKFRGRSYGTQLFDHALRVSTQPLQKLTVRADNVKALRMYERRGFKVEGPATPHFGKPYFLMARTKK